MSIPFDEINKAALVGYANRLKGWFPAGKLQGREFVLGDLAGSAGGSLSINTRTGGWADFSSSDKGGDPVSLYAAAFHNGNQADGAKALARELGIEVDGPAPSQQSRPAPSAKTEPDEKWYPSSPPPETPDPPLSRFDGVWTYHDAEGNRVGYVVRLNATPKRNRKIIYGINWGRRVWTDDKGVARDVTGWHNKHPDSPMPLYGLDLLAARPAAPVIVVEGEKACDAARNMFPDHVCVTWPRGVENVAYADWATLAGRWVIIWPDNDPVNKKGVRVGLEAAAKIEAALDGIATDAVTLCVDDLSKGDEPDGEDAADITIEDPAAWLELHMPRPTMPEPAPPVDDEPPPYIPEGDGEPPELPALREGVVPLGHDRQIYYYYSVSARQVIELSPERHSRAGLCSMASGTQHWEQIDHLRMAKGGGVDWAAAADWLMDKSRQIGIFNPDRVRGRGAWLDQGRAVLNLGNALIVDGETSPLMLAGSKFLYEAGNSFSDIVAPPVSTTEAYKLVKVCEALRWEKPVNAKLFAGFIAVAPICGALQWRPSIWVTGGAGSGKTFAMNSVMKKVIGKLALHVKASTSEAGIRAELGRDARPVMFDEAERESAAAAARMQATLELVRQSSSADDGDIVKSTQTQKSKKFRVQSCFAFQSINVGLEFAADLSRITVLALRESVKASAEDAAKFLEIENLVAETFTPEFSAGMLARSTSLVHVISANAETFARAIAKTLGNRRMGDQLGTLLAGAYSLHNTNLITPEAAETYVAAGDWAETTDANEEKDEMKAVRQLMSHKLRTGAVEYPVGRLIENMGNINDEGGPSFDTCKRLLLEAGIKYEGILGKPGIYIATSHPELKKAFAGTPWSVGWARAIARLPGGVPSTELNTVRFSMGSSSRAVWIPISSIDA